MGVLSSPSPNTAFAYTRPRDDNHMFYEIDNNNNNNNNYNLQLTL